jgi:hypothetical protein
MAMGDWDSGGDGDGDGNSNGSDDGNGVGDRVGKGNGKKMATARATMKEGSPLHVAAMCSAFGRAEPCLHPHGHKESASPVLHHGVIRQKVFAPCQGVGFPTASHGLFIVYFLQLMFSLLSNPLFAHHIIQALKNPVMSLVFYLFHSSKNSVSLLTIYPGFFCTFCQGKPGQGMQ